MRIINGIEELKKLSGQELGTGDWFTISQERINEFADVTGDHQWIHLDVERARKESPWGNTIAHGFLTLSLLPALSQPIYTVEGITTRINYGLDKVRFPAPVPAGSRVRAKIELVSIDDEGEGRYKGQFRTTIELEGSDRPACVAESIALLIL
jgi:acyl dehydratase